MTTTTTTAQQIDPSIERFITSTEGLDELVLLLQDASKQVDQLHAQVTKQVSGGKDERELYQWEFGQTFKHVDDVPERMEKQLAEHMALLKKHKLKSTVEAEAEKMIMAKLDHFKASMRELTGEITGLVDKDLGTSGLLIPLGSKDVEAVNTAQQNIANLTEELEEVAYLYDKYMKQQLQRKIDDPKNVAEFKFVGMTLFKLVEYLKQGRDRIVTLLSIRPVLRDMSKKLAAVRSALQKQRLARIQQQTPKQSSKLTSVGHKAAFNTPPGGIMVGAAEKSTSKHWKTGERGGRYYIHSSGRKIYKRRF